MGNYLRRTFLSFRGVLGAFILLLWSLFFYFYLAFDLWGNVEFICEKTRALFDCQTSEWGKWGAWMVSVIVASPLTQIGVLLAGLFLLFYSGHRESQREQQEGETIIHFARAALLEIGRNKLRQGASTGVLERNAIDAFIKEFEHAKLQVTEEKLNKTIYSLVNMQMLHQMFVTQGKPITTLGITHKNSYLPAAEKAEEALREFLQKKEQKPLWQRFRNWLG